MKLTLDERALSHVNAEGTRPVGARDYEISVGGGQPGSVGPTVAAEFAITGERQLPR